ncbi:hypothetical protein [Nitrospira moscoviensis]|uniref:hypothetical protein n=1 Tax=Nitrospira moscoviensis TaxID=42253 RepID=UPI0006A7B395|nr:hypothetical protein [Nitrospira moscoviensis]
MDGLLSRAPALKRLARRYTGVLLRQVIPTGRLRCIRWSKRFARVMLEMSDRAGKASIELSQ